MSQIDNSFVEQSLEYFNRNYTGRDLSTLPPNPLLERAILESRLNLQNASILDIGCGASNNLNWLSQKYQCRCYGVEPNSELVRVLSTKYPNIQYTSATADRLPFEDDLFDLVIVRSVWHWVDRNYILQALGEALRVSKRWLLVSDFMALTPYRVPYHHEEGLYTYHSNYSDILSAIGILKEIYAKYTGVSPEDGSFIDVSYDAIALDCQDPNLVKTSIYEKDASNLPTVSIST